MIVSLLLFSVALFAAEPDPCQEFHAFDKQVRQGVVQKTVARQSFQDLISRLKKYAGVRGSKPYPAGSRWIFPVEGGRKRDIGGRNGNGYRPKGYDYFDGNRHHGHPAQDIFIRDRNQDELDDRTGKPVVVRSVTDGLVIATEPDWNDSSPIRGGRYIVVYHAGSDEIFCYAHLRSVAVKVGDFLSAGQIIGDVGRSGKNAARKRSPTHLHFTRLRVNNGVPYPVNSYSELCRALGDER